MRPTGTEIYRANLQIAWARADRLFAWLLLAQWAFALIYVLVTSPYTYDGGDRSLHPHVWIALGFGGTLNAVPLLLVRSRAGWWGTRHAVAIAQMSWSALLIYISGGRIETHFHVFGSLAFLAFYRDWRVLVTATLVVSADHLVRGLMSPDSVYGTSNPEWWRFIEHASWVVFEDIVLLFGCWRGLSEMRLLADREAALAGVNAEIERRVEERTAELGVANESIAREMRSRLQAEAELRQAQKLESVGRLASGIAHEINTPVQFVSDSIHFLRDATRDLMDVVDKLQAVQQSALAGTVSAAAIDNAREAEEAADLPYLFERVPKAFERSLDGLGRVASIVRSMKAFAHPDANEMGEVDLNAAIESTLVIARNEYKYVADVVTDLGEIPQVTCFAGEINQAVLNILVNAAHAVDDVVRGDRDQGADHGAHALPRKHGPGRDLDLRHRHGHPGTHSRANLRSVLHDQGRRQRHRAGPRDRARHDRREARGPHRARVGGRSREYLSPPASRSVPAPDPAG